MFIPGTIEATEGVNGVHLDPYPTPSGELFPGLPVPSGDVIDCGAPFHAVKGCRCKLVKVRKHCDNRLCVNEYCMGKFRAKRASRIERRFEAARAGRPAFYLVATVPPERRQAAADKKTWKSWLDRLRRFLVDKHGLQFAVERTDPAGKCEEANRTGQACTCAHCLRWHPHVNLLAVFAHGRFTPHQKFTREELAGLKDKWGEIVGARRRPVVYLDFAWPDHPKWNRKTGKPNSREYEERRLGAWFSYMGRTWPQWEREFPYHLRVKWFGTAPATPKEKHVDCCCDVCGEEVVFFAVGSEVAAEEMILGGYDRLKEEAEWRRFENLRRSDDRRLRRKGG